MLAGRPPKPIETKTRIGNPGQRGAPLQSVRLLPVATVPPAPKGLRRHGRQSWEHYFRTTTTPKGSWIRPSDYPLLARLCEAHDERAALKTIIRKEGRFTGGSMGQTVTHPAVDQLRALEQQMTRWESLLGLTPVDRSRLGLMILAAEAEGSKLEAFLNRGRGSG